MNGSLIVRFVCLSAALTAWGCGGSAFASAREAGSNRPGKRGVWCTYVYEGVQKRLAVAATREPYRVPMLDLDRAFGVKWVNFIDAAGAAHFAAYVYDLSGGEPLPLHESKYEEPFAVGGRYGFTGAQFAYRSDGDELEFHCSVEAP